MNGRVLQEKNNRQVHKQPGYLLCRWYLFTSCWQRNMKVIFFRLLLYLSVPTGLLGVFAFINFAGIENNIYVQVGLIMLVGLLAKNAILIVEYAVQRRKAGFRISSQH